MVGGGPGAFIGGVHRMAAALDGEWELVAGAFASDPGRSREQGRALGLDAQRVYGSFRDMVRGEAALGGGQRIDAVAIVTPNHLHHPVATAFLEAGFHVVCDKPMTTTAADAEDLCRTVERARLVFALTHNYSGYPMVKEARRLVRLGRLGTLRKVVAAYPQGWLATRLEATAGADAAGHKQAAWRQDAAQAGPSSVVGDIGTPHPPPGPVRDRAGGRVRACGPGHPRGGAGPGRRRRYSSAIQAQCQGPERARCGARGVFHASQVSAGEENGLALRVYGERGGLVWRQEEPNRLNLLYADAPRRRLTRGGPGLGAAARRATRLPPGHPEGFIEAFANLYQCVGRTIGARIVGAEPGSLDLDFPDHADGLAGVRFVEGVVRSSVQERWVRLGVPQ